MWNRHIKVPKIVSGLLFPVKDMNCSIKMIIWTFFYVDKINEFKARIISVKVIINNFQILKTIQKLNSNISYKILHYYA